MLYSDETVRQWKAGEIDELAGWLDDQDGEGTFFKWIDAGLGHDYPAFVSGDEALFEKHKMRLVSHAQDNRPIEA